jgi:hypothetical protein
VWISNDATGFARYLSIERGRETFPVEEWVSFLRKRLSITCSIVSESQFSSTKQYNLKHSVFVAIINLASVNTVKSKKSIKTGDISVCVAFRQQAGGLANR